MDPETARAVPLTKVSAKITARDLEIVQDKPADYGGDNQGMMASELLMAALLSCQLSTYAKIAEKRGSDAELHAIEAETQFDDKGDIERIDLLWYFGDDVDAKVSDTLMKLTDKVCTISRALSCPVHYRRA